MINTSTISHGDPNKKEPDILCNFIDGKNYGFELTEACCPEYFQAIANIKPEDNGVVCAWGGDVTDITVKKKLEKSYSKDCPIDLIVYVNGMTAANFQILKDMILPILRETAGPFERVWLMVLDEETDLIYP